MPPWRDHLDAHRDQAVEQLKELLSIPSVSTDEAYQEDVRKAAEWVLAFLEDAGFDGGLETVDGGHPIVVARHVVDEDAPTVALYGHYDVQPPDPVEAWKTPPFEPTVEDGRIRARGATDDKGQLLANLLAVAAHVEAGTLGVNVQVLIEGEEETSGESLPRYIEANREALKVDAVVVSDTSLWSQQHPAITHGLRGIVAIEVTARGADEDLHSGMYGGAIPNPAEALARALASLKDDGGRVSVPGFYDGVRELSDTERDLLAKVPFDEASYLAETGAAGFSGEADRGVLERLWTRPTLEVNGLSGGYAGKGFKTVLPATATAKVSCRLVPDQDPAATGDAVLRAIEDALPANVRVEGRVLAHAPAWVQPPDHAVLQTAKACLEEAFGGTCLFIRSGGSIPVVPTLETLGPTVLMGYGMEDERLHAPNEFFRLDHFHKGAVACGSFLERMTRP